MFASLVRVWVSRDTTLSRDTFMFVLEMIFFFFFQTTILNLLTSELVVVNNPLISDDAVNGACLLDSHCILYGATEWVLVTMQGAVQQRHHAKMEAGFEMLTMDFRSLDEYHSTLWTGNLEDKRIIFQSHLGGHRTRPVHLNDALVVNRGRNVLFSCCDPSKPDVTLYRLKTGTYCFVSGLIVISVPWNSFVMFLWCDRWMLWEKVNKVLHKWK